MPGGVVAERMPAPSDSRWERLEDDYVLAALLIALTVIAYAVGADHRLGQMIVVTVQSLTLLVILRASRVSKRALAVAAVLIVLPIAATSVSVSLDRQSIGPGVVGALLAFIGPIVIVRRVRAHARIDFATVAGALCVYLLAGLFFAYVYRIIDLVDGGFFAQHVSAGAVDFVYFSFTTLTTLGYGDLTARLDLGRMLAVSEALFGQLYLVSVVALLVGNFGQSRGVNRVDGDVIDG